MLIDKRTLDHLIGNSFSNGYFFLSQHRNVLFRETPG